VLKTPTKIKKKGIIKIIPLVFEKKEEVFLNFFF
jgi:hypothetical protein